MFYFVTDMYRNEFLWDNGVSIDVFMFYFITDTLINKYFWDNGMSVDVNMWAPGEPNEVESDKGVRFKDEGNGMLLGDKSENNNNNYICQRQLMCTYFHFH